MWMGEMSTKTLGHGPHSHPVPEVLIAIGSDPENPKDLGAEFEMFMGEEMEKHIINKSTMIYVPANTVHCPFTITKGDPAVSLYAGALWPQTGRNCQKRPGTGGNEN